MKLYTEEVIRKRLNNPYNVEVTIDEFIESLTPIELPSDEEINEEINSDIHIESDADFFNGAKYVINKIQGGKQ